MKKQILDSLKTKFDGVSESILDRIAAKLAKTVTDESGIEAAVEAVTFSSLLESYGDSRATEAQRTAIKTYEEKYGLKDGKTVQSGQGGSPDPEPAPDPNAALLAKLQAMEDRLAAMDSEKRNAGRRGQLDTIVARLPEALRAPYSRMDVSSMSDDDFARTVESVSTEVDTISNSLKVKGAVFGRPRADMASVDRDGEVPPNVLKFLDAQAKGEEDKQNF